MTKELMLAEALKGMMANTPLDKITVKHLTERIKITRPTFYYHFRDIYDLLAWIYLNEKIEGFDEVATWEEALLKIGRYCLDNKSLVKQTNASAGRDLLIEFLTNRLYAFNMKHIEQIDKDSKIELDTKKQLARFYSAALNSILLAWIETGMNESLKDIITKVSPYIGDYYKFDFVEDR